jgi:serine/threonine protein kinase
VAERPALPRTVGRYLLYDEIASGGMAAVHFGRMVGDAGFARTVAIKRLHKWLAKDPEFVSMFIDEARLASRIAHPNVVTTVDVVNHEGEMLIVMEYIAGASLSFLQRRMAQRNEPIPAAIAVALMSAALAGLHAAHEARSDAGELLGVVHRDVSPQNILVGADGVARVVDFGIAKAVGRVQTTRDGQLKGKAAYMAPEQIRGVSVDRRTDVYAASVVLWETLVGERLFVSDHPLGIMNAVFEKRVPLVSEARASVPATLDPIVAKGLAREPQDRFATARDMMIALERAAPAASIREVGDWVGLEAEESLARRARRVAEIESSSDTRAPPRHAPAVSRESVPESPSEPLAAPSEADSRTSSSHVSDARPRRSGHGLAVITLVLAVTCVALSVGLWRSSRRAPGAALPPPPPASASPTAQPATGPDVESPSDRVADATASAPTSAAEESQTSPSSPLPPSPLPNRPSPAATPRRNPPARTPGPGCNPPYTVDPDGTRHWKAGC